MKLDVREKIEHREMVKGSLIGGPLINEKKRPENI